ncbi:MAG: S8 family serine peptidase [Desulfobulbaceae bacterium]
MKISMFATGYRIFLAPLLLLATSVMAANAQDGPPFKQGEVVVAGPPGPHLAGLPVAKYLPNANLTVVRVAKGKEFGQVQKFIRQGRRAGLNYIAQASLVPDDPYSSPMQWNFPAVQAPEAWNLSAGDGIVVAVLDTGLQPGGPDGIGCVVAPQDIVNSDSDPADGDGHGTHVAGTIAQRTNNGIGVAGLAYEACIMPVKVLDDSGSGTFADIAEGIYWAVGHGAKVINMSLGTNARYAFSTDPIMDAALKFADDSGVTVVCAAGNNGSRKNVSYPAIYPTTIAVGATDYTNTVTRYSNKGKGLDIVAPGGDTTRDLNHDGYGDGILQETSINGWDYYFFQGTSMASPHVAAAAAFLLANNPGLTPQEVRTALTATALDLNEAGYDSTSGYGLLQVYNALTGGEVGTPGTDGDRDGWPVENGDCDDTNSDVYPGHQDVKGVWGRDGVDNDCNGIIDG